MYAREGPVHKFDGDWVHFPWLYPRKATLASYFVDHVNFSAVWVTKWLLYKVIVFSLVSLPCHYFLEEGYNGGCPPPLSFTIYPCLSDLGLHVLHICTSHLLLHLR